MQASKQITNERHITFGIVRQHASVTVSGQGILSLPLCPLFSNRLVTGEPELYSVALVYSWFIGTYVF